MEDVKIENLNTHSPLNDNINIPLEDTKLINKIETEMILKKNQPEDFFTKDKDSLMLYQETKHEMFEKLRLNWTSHHRRIQDFKMKQMMKFPQIFYLNYETIYDLNRQILENKSSVISKYTFNLENDMEIDLGGNLNMRDNMGLGSIFSSLRFYSFRNRLFTNLSYSFGDKNNFTLESNYLFSNSLLVDYIYKNKSLSEDSKHKLTLHKLWKDNSKVNTGVYMKNNSLNAEENFFGIFFGGKKYFNNKKQSLEGGIKLSNENLKIKGKFKENLTKNFYSISTHNLIIDGYFPLLSSHNQIVYKFFNKFFKFGYFYNLNGIGVEFGYQSAGLEVNFPFLFFKGDFKIEEEMNKSFLIHLLGCIQQFVVFSGINFLTKIFARKIKQILKNRKSVSNNESSNTGQCEKLKKSMIEVRIYQEKIVNQIKIQADKNQLCELNKTFGMKINFAVYGNKKILKKIMNECHLIEKEKLQEYLQGIILDVENEVVDVTIPVKYMIKREDKNSISSIFFHQVPKTKIVGFINPIFKSDKEPWLLINYEIAENSFTIMKRDGEVFQIPEKINF
jgi:hypothetical protein